MTTPDAWVHVPVMVEEVLRYLRPEAGGVFYDLTLGLGGHAHALLSRAPADARLYGLDRDPEALSRARERLAAFGERAVTRHGSFADLAEVAEVDSWPTATGILLDLGVSSPQIDVGGRGFSFRREGPLDMRMDPTSGVPACDWIERVSTKELAHALREYADEFRAEAIARRIHESLPIRTTRDLVRVIERVLPPRRGSPHPAMRTFQALRIAVNDELGALERGVRAAAGRLAPGGRIVVLSYHSGEDRIVKCFLRDEARAGRLVVLTRRPERPTIEESGRNPRADSAKLRAAERPSTSSAPAG
ncbi:MAG: 16S rRNA (cytosine(1402)-N(4))-methyltransferase RsmH [Planctomycetota bacterium]